MLFWKQAGIRETGQNGNVKMKKKTDLVETGM